MYIEAEHRRNIARKRHGRYDWQITSLSQILKNRVYIGEWSYAKSNAKAVARRKKSIIKDFVEANSDAVLNVPALVDNELFEGAQVKLDQNKARTRRKSKNNYLLQRRCTCGLCDYKMVCITQSRNLKSGGRKSYHYYICSWKNKNATVPTTGHKCRLPQFRRDRVDMKVWEWLKKIMLDEKEIEQGFEDYKAEQAVINDSLIKQLAQIEREEKELNRELDKQTSAYIDLEGNDRARANIKTDIKRIEHLLDRLDAKQQEISAKIGQAENSEARIKNALQFATKIGEGFAKADGIFAKQREIIEALDVKVTLTVEDGKMKIYPEFVFNRAEEGLLYNQLNMV